MGQPRRIHIEHKIDIDAKPGDRDQFICLFFYVLLTVHLSIILVIRVFSQPVTGRPPIGVMIPDAV